MIEYKCDYVDEPLRARLFNEGKTERLTNKKLGYNIIEDGVVLPCVNAGSNWRTGGGIISSDGYEDNSACYTYVRNFGCPYEYDKEKVERVNETVIYAGMFSRVWGHCITDNLSLIWFLKSEYYDEYKNSKIIYTAPEGGLAPNFIELLRLAGIDASKFERIIKPTVFSRIILPEKCFFTVGKIPDFSDRLTFSDCADMRVSGEYKKLIGDILNSVPEATDDKYDKVYFSRARFSKGDVGEYKLDKFFFSCGYTVIYPEKYTLVEQISILKRCNHFAATEGSVSHNSVFLKPNTEALLLVRGTCFTPHSFAVNAVNDVKATFISVTLSVLTNREWPNSGPHFYYVSDYLLKYFSKEYLSENPAFCNNNFKDFKKYIKKYGEIGSKELRYCEEGYYKKLNESLSKYYALRERAFPRYLKHPRFLANKIKEKLKEKGKK